MEHFRRIDISGMLSTPLSPQPAPQMLWVEIDNLVIDDRYQRPLNGGNRAAIRRIATAFRWSRFSPVIVAPIEGGRYALIDGQHRAHAAALCGITSIPAMVALVAPEEQAQAFIEINTRQIRVKSQNIYRAALTARDDWAVRAEAAVSAAGCRLMTSNFSTKDKKPGMVFAVDLIRRMIEQKRDSAVTSGLAALLQYDPESVPNFSNTLLTPWLGAVAETASPTHDLVAVLNTRRPWLVIEAADRMAEEDKKPKAQKRRDFFVTSIRRLREDAA